jgi:transcriptional regulator with XRE-family HTH domain
MAGPGSPERHPGEGNLRRLIRKIVNVESKESWLNKPGGITERLRRLRAAAGLTGEQMAERLGWPRPKISKLENGRQVPKRTDITSWAEICGDPAAAAELLDMLDEGVAAHRPYRHTRRNSQAAHQDEFDQIVRGAKRIRNFEMSLIPGLLQTPEYARWRAIEVSEVYGYPADGIDATVATRMRRQEALYDLGHQFEFVITEAALALTAAPPAVMASQVDRLTTISGQPNVTFGIIPFYTAAKLPALPMHGFITVDDVTFIETHSAQDDIPPTESGEYSRFMDLFLAEALTGDDVRQVLMASFARWRSLAAGE